MDLIYWTRKQLEPIQWFLLSKWDESSQTFDKQISKAGFPWELMMWCFRDEIFYQRTPFHKPVPDHCFFTKASEEDRGANLGRPWNQRQVHYNSEQVELELQRTYCGSPSRTTISTDSGENQLACIHGQHIDSFLHTPPGQNKITKFIPACRTSREHVLPSWYTGESTTHPKEAERSCRSAVMQNQTIQTKWILHSSVCRAIFTHCEKPNIDLFATRLNNQLPALISPYQDEKGRWTVIGLFGDECMSLPPPSRSGWEYWRISEKNREYTPWLSRIGHNNLGSRHFSTSW